MNDKPLDPATFWIIIIIASIIYLAIAYFIIFAAVKNATKDIGSKISDQTALKALLQEQINLKKLELQVLLHYKKIAAIHRGSGSVKIIGLEDIAHYDPSIYRYEIVDSKPSV